MTHLLAFSRKTEGLFHRYILHSGSALSTWAVRPQRGYRQTCLKLAKLVGCQVQKGDDVIVSNETTTENPKEDVRRSVYDDNLRPYDTQPYTRKDDEEILRCMRTVDARTLEAMTQYFVSAISGIIKMLMSSDDGLLCISLFGESIHWLTLVPRWRMTRRTPS